MDIKDFIVVETNEIKLNKPKDVSIFNHNNGSIKYLDVYVTVENVKTKEQIPLVIRITGQSFKFIDPKKTKLIYPEIVI